MEAISCPSCYSETRVGRRYQSGEIRWHACCPHCGYSGPGDVDKEVAVLLHNGLVTKSRTAPIGATNEASR
jgi:phage terminase large subunit GpA-like protein